MVDDFNDEEEPREEDQSGEEGGEDGFRPSAFFDDLREEASESTYFDDFTEEPVDSFAFGDEVAAPSRLDNLFGMTAAQRLVIAVMLLGTACILSTFCLLVFNKISF
jgi:hypothetical protein